MGGILAFFVFQGIPWNLVGRSSPTAEAAPLGQNTVLKCVEYKWGDPAPGYRLDGLIFESWLDVRIENPCPEAVFNVTGTISWCPANCEIVDGNITVGDLPGGSSAWSQDTFKLRVDMAVLGDPNEGIVWRIEYDDADGNHHVLEGVPEFADEEPPSILPTR